MIQAAKRPKRATEEVGAAAAPHQVPPPVDEVAQIEAWVEELDHPALHQAFIKHLDAGETLTDVACIDFLSALTNVNVQHYAFKRFLLSQWGDKVNTWNMEPREYVKSKIHEQASDIFRQRPTMALAADFEELVRLLGVAM